MSCCALILAAGYSSRMKGHLKPLLSISGETFLQNIGNKLKQAGISDIFVVTGYKEREIRQAHVHENAFIWVYNPDYPHGMFSSLQAGIKTLHNHPHKYKGILMQPVDIPLVSVNTYISLLQAFNANTAAIIKPVYKKQCGHPIIFPGNKVTEILSSPPQTITSRLFEKDNAFVPVNDPYILKDVDFYEDYIRMEGNNGG